MMTPAITRSMASSMARLSMSWAPARAHSNAASFNTLARSAPVKPGVREYLIPSHQGKEPAAVKLADALQLSPVIHAGMALGEGTGAVMMFTLLDMAMSIYGQSATFSEIEVEQYRR